MSKDSADGQAEDVEQAIQEYDLTGFKQRIDGISDRDKEDRRSIRQLARDCNAGIVSTMIDRVGTDRPEYTAREITAQLMTNYCPFGPLDQPDEQTLNEIEDWFEQQESPVADFVDDFVNHHAVRKYLFFYANEEENDRSPEELRSHSLDRLGGLEKRYNSVGQSLFDALERAGVLSDAEYSFDTRFEVTCTNCQQQVSAVEYIEYGGCPNCLTDQ